MDGSRLDITCSASSRAGKTTLARLLADFAILNDPAAPPRLFDTAVPEGELERRYPTDCELLDMHNTQAQLRMLDPLVDPVSGPRHHVIDLANPARLRLLSIAETTGFDAAAADCGTRIVIWHMMEPDLSSLRSFQHFRSAFPKARLVAVRGPAMHEAARLEWSSIDIDMVPADAQLTVPWFTRGTANTIAAEDFSFAGFVAGGGQGVHPVIRDELMSALVAFRDAVAQAIA